MPERRFEQILRAFTLSREAAKVSADYQSRMGAIDNHSSRRQSGKSVKGLEQVCVTRSTKGRISMNAVGRVMLNLFRAKKHCVNGESNVPDTDESEPTSEFQEQFVMELINNQYLAEAPVGSSPDNSMINNIESCVKHPKYKSNLCKFCHQRGAVYICNVCSNPGRSKVRKEKSSKGNVKMTDPGFNHFCKGGCFAQHKCGATSHRRPRGSLPKADGFAI